MSTFGSPDVPTPIGITRSITGKRAEAEEGLLSVSPYWMLRSPALFFGFQAVMLGMVVVGALLTEAAVYRALPVLFVGFQLSMMLNRVHLRLGSATLKELASMCAWSVALGMLLSLAACALVPALWIVYPGAVSAGALSSLSLLALSPLAPVLVNRRWLSEGVLIVGSGSLAVELERELERFSPFLSGKGRDRGRPHRIGVASRELKSWAWKRGFTRIVLADPPSVDSRALAAALIECRACGIEVEQAVDSYGRLNSKIWLAGLHPHWLVYAPTFLVSRSYLRFKRAADLVLVTLLATLLLPLLALIALLIRLESPGPILFQQERVGLNGQRFQLAKFRSMRKDAERESGPTWSRAGDPRITRVGRVLRKFRLDELPQMINVLRGEMSLIGPRPERPAFVERLSPRIPFYDVRHSVKPGISGWAQVMYPYGASLEDAYEKLQFDLFYIKNLSLGLDLEIFLRTIKVVLSGGGR